MTILRYRFRESFPAGSAYALAAYALAAGALLLYLLLCRADAKPVMYVQYANSLAAPVALAAIPEPVTLALLGTGLVSAHLALRRRRRARRSDPSNRHATLNFAGGEQGLITDFNSRQIRIFPAPN